MGMMKDESDEKRSACSRFSDRPEAEIKERIAHFTLYSNYVFSVSRFGFAFTLIRRVDVRQENDKRLKSSVHVYKEIFLLLVDKQNFSYAFTCVFTYVF